MNVFDELRFGPERTLNLRDGLPSAAHAVERAELWLRERQVRGDKEALIITGRGRRSPGGIGVIREAIEKLLFSLRRRGVIAGHQEHNSGAFAIELAPLRALAEAIPRKRDRGALRSNPSDVHGLSSESNALLRALAERSLDALGVTHAESRIADEMQRQLKGIVPGLRGGVQMEGDLNAALRAAIAEYD